MHEGVLPVEGEQIVMLPSHKDNNCFIMPINICVCNVKKNNKKKTTKKKKKQQQTNRTLINAVSLFHLQSNYCEYKYLSISTITNQLNKLKNNNNNNKNWVTKCQN